MADRQTPRFKALPSQGKHIVDRIQKGHCLHCPTVLEVGDVAYHVPNRGTGNPRWYCIPCGKTYEDITDLQVQQIKKEFEQRRYGSPRPMTHNHFCPACQKHIDGSCTKPHSSYNWCGDAVWPLRGPKQRCGVCDRRVTACYEVEGKTYCKGCLMAHYAKPISAPHRRMILVTPVITAPTGGHIGGIAAAWSR